MDDEYIGESFYIINHQNVYTECEITGLKDPKNLCWLDDVPEEDVKYCFSVEFKIVSDHICEDNLKCVKKGIGSVFIDRGEIVSIGCFGNTQPKWDREFITRTLKKDYEERIHNLEFNLKKQKKDYKKLLEII